MTCLHQAAFGGHLPIVEVFIELELNPFEIENVVSRSCCVSMTVVFVDRRAKHQEILLPGTATEEWPTVSSSTKVCLPLSCSLHPSSSLNSRLPSQLRHVLRLVHPRLRPVQASSSSRPPRRRPSPTAAECERRTSGGGGRAVEEPRSEGVERGGK